MDEVKVDWNSAQLTIEKIRNLQDNCNLNARDTRLPGLNVDATKQAFLNYDSSIRELIFESAYYLDLGAKDTSSDYLQKLNQIRNRIINPYLWEVVRDDEDKYKYKLVNLSSPRDKINDKTYLSDLIDHLYMDVTKTLHTRGFGVPKKISLNRYTKAAKALFVDLDKKKI